MAFWLSKLRGNSKFLSSFAAVVRLPTFSILHKPFFAKAQSEHIDEAFVNFASPLHHLAHNAVQLVLRSLIQMVVF